MHKNNDVRLLFATRIARMFAYGFLSVVLLLYLAELGLTENPSSLLHVNELFRREAAQKVAQGVRGCCPSLEAA